MGGTRKVIGVRTVAALTMGLSIGYLGGDYLPELLDSFRADLNLSDTSAGAVATCLLLSTAIASLLMVRRANRPGRGRLATIGAGVSAAGFAAAGLAPDLLWLVPASIVAGAGGGLVLAVGTAALSATADPDRASGLSVLNNGLFGAIVMILIPVVARGHHLASFLVLTGLCLIAIPILRWLPDAPVAEQTGRIPILPVGVALFVGAVVLEITENGIWAFVAQIGTDEVGLSEQAVGAILAVTILFGIVGALVQVVVAARFGFFIPVVLLVLLVTAAKSVLLVWHQPGAFVGSQLVWTAAFAALFAYMLAFGAELDDRGAWAAATASAVAFGDALGPFLTGVVLDSGGYPLMLAVTLVAGAVVVVLFGWVARTLDRRRAGAGRSAVSPRSGA